MLTSQASKRHIVCIIWAPVRAPKVAESFCPLECFMLDFSLLPLLVFMIFLWQRTLKLQRFGSSCFWAFHCFGMDSKELSSISDCFGDQITNKNTKTYTIWLEMIAKVLNMLIELKGNNNYYSKVFKRVNYKLSNSTFWVVITPPNRHFASPLAMKKKKTKIKIVK